MHRAARERIHGLVDSEQRTLSADDCPTPKAALRELLRGRGLYQEDPSGDILAPFEPGIVSIPDHTDGCKNIVDMVGAVGQFYLEGDGQRMLRDRAEVEIELTELGLKAYNDPRLEHQRGVYAKFINMLLERNMVAFETDPKEHTGRSRCGRRASLSKDGS